MKIELPFIKIDTSNQKEANVGKQVASISTPMNPKTYDIIGGLLTFTKSALSTEKSISTKLLQANKEWVYRNNDVIAQEVSNIEFELYTMSIRSGEIVFDIIESHPLLDLLDRLNSRTTKFDGFYMTQSHKKLTGDAFWLLNKNGSVVESVYILPPDKIELILASPNNEGDLIEGYRYIDVIDGNEIDRTYQPDQIVHFKKPNPSNPFRGYGAVEALADTIDTDNLTNEVQRQFFEKGAISNFVLTSESNITDEQLKRLKAEMKAMYQGAKNAYNTMIFGNGLKPADIGFSNKDMEFLNLLEWYRDKIMVGFGNTKASLGLIDDVNRASYDSSHVAWLRGTIKPDMTSICQTLNEFLVPMFGENLILGFKDPVPENITEKSEQATKLKTAGIITRNEAREMVGFSPVEGGDEFVEDNQEPMPIDSEEAKKIRKLAKAVPASVRNINYKGILRERGIYLKQTRNQQIKNWVKPIVAKAVKEGKDSSEVVMPSTTFSEETINEYYAKQMGTIDLYEAEFETRLLKILNDVKEEAMDNLDNEIRSVKGLKRFIKTKALFDEEKVIVQAQLDLTPLLMGVVTSSGQDALTLISITDVYVPYKITNAIRTNVEKFTKSMVSTDKEKLSGYIDEGIANGRTITEIRDSIKEQFGDYTKMQAERITRTEVVRASIMAAEDAFIQSGVVEGKQWHISPGADSQCTPYAGKVVKLGKSFYSEHDTFKDGNPPIHPNCRCYLVPIVIGTEPTKNHDHEADKLAMLEKIKELEANFDKRTKEYKEFKKKHNEERASDKEWIKTLEDHFGLNDE